jgi:hypothetical protein
MTTSNLRFVITPSARIENGTAQVFMSEDLVKALRTNKINPHPLWAQLSNGGVVFAFKATPGANMTIQFVQTSSGVRPYDLTTGTRKRKAH